MNPATAAILINAVDLFEQPPKGYKLTNEIRLIRVFPDEGNDFLALQQKWKKRKKIMWVNVEVVNDP